MSRTPARDAPSAAEISSSALSSAQGRPGCVKSIPAPTNLPGPAVALFEATAVAPPKPCQRLPGVPAAAPRRAPLTPHLLFCRLKWYALKLTDALGSPAQIR